jgi:hypothetical protein
VERDERDAEVSLFRVDLRSGRREALAHLEPADPAGVRMMFPLVVSGDGKAWAYACGRQLTTLYLVEGLS